MAKSKKEWNALAGVRSAIKGWAFVDHSKLPAYISRAEEQKGLVAAEFYDAAEELIKPLREYV